VLAEPISDSYAGEIRASVINEMRAVRAASLALGAPSPLAEHYIELLQTALDGATQAQSLGAWRVAAYLMAEDEATYYRLAAAWRGVFSGPGSLPEPVRTWRSDNASSLATLWAMPYAPAPAGPGHYRHSFTHQTLLTSAQLAGYVHLPQRETAGFSVTSVPDFDVVRRPTRNERMVSLGSVVERRRRTDIPYWIDVDDLTRHAFIAGVTGSGKTNTIFHLLNQVDAAGVPFLVIEPAKTEYRALLDDPELGGRLALFTLGDEQVSPLRLNPFEVPPGTKVGEHLDLLRSAFHASFGMWTPLPQVLERCLHAVYEERGWDVASDTNHRLEQSASTWLAFPTLTDLVAAVDRITPTLGYEDRVTADIRAALTTRLNSLRQGGKGRMFDVGRSLSMDALLAQPTVLELEPLGDDEDKAFLIGLLLIRLAEHRRTGGQAAGLRHLLVIEEAHRLLAMVSGRRHEEEADPRAKAVEAFGHLLSEVRAYGQGIVVADQVPVKLLPDVIKNTNLKVAHRVVAADDQAVLAATMAMTDRQGRSLAILPVGQAAAFAEGDDVPVLVQVPSVKPPAPATTSVASPAGHSHGERIAAQMRRWRQASLGMPEFPPYSDCDRDCPRDGRICGLARRLGEETGFSQTFGRVVQSTMEDPDALDRLWPDLVAEVWAQRPPGIDGGLLLRAMAVHGVSRFVSRRGATAGWSYDATDSMARLLQSMLLARVDGQDSGAAGERFRQFALALHARSHPPYQACEQVCQQRPPVCLYRHAVAEYIAMGDQSEAWRRADVGDAVSGDGDRSRTWEVGLDAAYALIEFPEEDWSEERRRHVSDAARRVALCFSQQMLDRDPAKSPRTVRRITDKLLKEAVA
jgi:hypothetical protein